LGLSREMSALCQKRTYAAQQKSRPIRSTRRRAAAVPVAPLGRSYQRLEVDDQLEFELQKSLTLGGGFFG